MARIQYNKGDIIGDYGVEFIQEIEPHFSPTKKYRKAKFKCGFCGKIFEAVINDVKRNNIKSCGCYRKISKSKTHIKDITGEKRGLLTAIKRLDKQAPDNSYYWLFQCDCGQTTEIPISDFGKTKSCGCLLFHSYGEKITKQILEEYSIEYEFQKTFADCQSKKGYLLKFDFYVPKNRTCIEIDGRQHYEAVEYFGGEKAFQTLKENDIIKNNYCFENNIKIIRIKNKDRKLNKNKLLEILRQEEIIE